MFLYNLLNMYILYNILYNVYIYISLYNHSVCSLLWFDFSFNIVSSIMLSVAVVHVIFPAVYSKHLFSVLLFSFFLFLQT